MEITGGIGRTTPCSHAKLHPTPRAKRRPLGLILSFVFFHSYKKNFKITLKNSSKSQTSYAALPSTRSPPQGQKKAGATEGTQLASLWGVVLAILTALQWASPGQCQKPKYHLPHLQQCRNITSLATGIWVQTSSSCLTTRPPVSTSQKCATKSCPISPTDTAQLRNMQGKISSGEKNTTSSATA